MDNKLYNPEIKERFLSTYDNEQTQTTLRYILYKAAPIEQALGKDLYDFNDIDLLGNVIKNTDPLNKNTLRVNSSFISNYITWAISEGLRSNIHPLKGIGDEWYDQLMDELGKKKLYLSESELLELESKLVNYQDKIVIRLLFEGISGHNMNELVNLKEQDVNFDTGELKLTDPEFKGRVRDTVTVSKHCLSLIKGALAEREYSNKNGTATRSRDMPLVENDYVIRPIARKVNNPYAKADKHLIYRRLTVISELFDLPFLTAKSINKSGMLKYAKDIYLRDKEWDTKQIYEVADRFGLRKIKQGEYEFHNRTAIEQYVNRENILELYGIDVSK